MLNYVGPGNLDGSWPGDAHTISLTSSCLLHSSDVSGLGGKRSTARGIARKDMKGYERIWKDGGRARNCALSVSGQTSEVWSDILVRGALSNPWVEYWPAAPGCWASPKGAKRRFPVHPFRTNIHPIDPFSLGSLGFASWWSYFFLTLVGKIDTPAEKNKVSKTNCTSWASISRGRKLNKTREFRRGWRG